MAQKLVVLTMSAFNRRDYERFGVGIFLDNGFDVEVWDVSGALYPAHKAHYIPVDPIQENTREFFDKREVRRAITALAPGTTVLCFINFDRESLFIYRAMSSRNIPYVFNNCNIPPPGPKQALAEKIRRKLRNLPLHPAKWPGLASYALVKKMPALAGVQPPRYIVAGGKHSLLGGIFAGAEIIWAHSFDYDRYLECEQAGAPDIIGKKYAVFLDHGTPYHPDNFSMEGKMPSGNTPERYYPGIVKFFREVEQHTGLEVVVAAHPRWRFEECPDHYEGRTILRGDTVRLVKYADLVLAHNSTSLAFANMYRKPVLFIHSLLHNRAVINAAAAAFGKQAHYTADEPIDWQREMSVSEDAYTRYRENYIKRAGTPELPVWQIVANTLNTRNR